jgi:NADH-quinone oxidoreductase subunit C
VDVLTLLRDKYEFELLSALTAVDYFPKQTPRFHVVYQLSSLAKNVTVQVRVPVNGDQPRVPTATRIYEVANWREREVFDMFGIEFEGHPDPRRILMPDDQEGHPLRKDFPLGYEEPQFTFNFDEIDLRKPYAKE